MLEGLHSRFGIITYHFCFQIIWSFLFIFCYQIELHKMIENPLAWIIVWSSVLSLFGWWHKNSWVLRPPSKSSIFSEIWTLVKLIIRNRAVCANCLLINNRSFLTMNSHDPHSINSSCTFLIETSFLYTFRGLDLFLISSWTFKPLMFKGLIMF